MPDVTDEEKDKIQAKLKKKNENEINSEEDDDYSVGADESEFGVKYSDLKQNKKMIRLSYLWRQLWQKLRCTTLSLIALKNLKKRTINYGTTTNLMHDTKLVAKENDNFCSKRLVFDPDHKFLLLWNPIVIVALLFTAFATPYKIAFVKNDTNFDYASNTVIDCIFFLDLIFNFLLAYEDPLSR